MPDSEAIVRTLAVERPPRSPLPKIFVALVPLIYAIELLVVRRPRIHPDSVIALAVTIDLTIVVPLLYWFLVVRPAGASAGRVVAAFAVSLLGARLVLPPEQRQYLQLVRHLVAPAELLLIGWLVLRVRRFTRDVGNGGAAMDVPERIRAALLHAMPYRATAEVFATELSLGWYALLSWRRMPHVPGGMWAFSTHRRTGTTAILATLMAATVVEAVPLHFLLRTWTPRLAWLLTALSALALVWILGLLRSVQLRPVLLDAERLVVRAGIRWSVAIPREAIAGVEVGHLKLPRGDARLLRATIATQPNVVVHLRAPVPAIGMYGTSREELTTIAFAVDDRHGLAAALTSACPT